jgi:methylamine dehydrogenase accessory protein MauD
VSGVWLMAFATLWLLVLIEAFFIFAILRQLGLLQGRFPEQPAALSIGSEAPDFELQDLSGRSLAQSAHRGRGLLLAVVSPTCSGCTKLVPAINAYLQAAAQGPPVWLICVGSDDACRGFASDHAVRAPVLRDVALTVWNSYKLSTFPWVLSIDRKGVIQGSASVIDLSGLEHLADRAFPAGERSTQRAQAHDPVASVVQP